MSSGPSFWSLRPLRKAAVGPRSQQPEPRGSQLHRTFRLTSGTRSLGGPRTSACNIRCVQRVSRVLPSPSSQTGHSGRAHRG